MYFEWITRLFRAAKAPASRLAEDPIVPPADPGVDSAIFDLRSIAEYPLDQRQPLAPELQRELARLSALLRARVRRDAQQLMPLPLLAQRLLAALESNADLDVNSLVGALHQDAAVVAQILRTANSAAYLGRGRVQGVREAIMRVGPAAARQVALSAALDALVDGQARRLPASLGPICRRQWIHALTVAQSAGWLTMVVRRGDVEHAYLAGLLHDLGKLAALQALPRLTSEVLPEELVDTLLEDCHVEVGGLVASAWRLPNFVISVISDHHERPEANDQVETHLVRLCSGLDEIRSNPRHHMGLAGKVLDTAAQLGVSNQGLRALVTQLREADARASQQRVPSQSPRVSPRRGTTITTGTTGASGTTATPVPAPPPGRAIPRSAPPESQGQRGRPQTAGQAMAGIDARPAPEPPRRSSRRGYERALEQLSLIGTSYEPDPLHTHILEALAACAD